MRLLLFEIASMGPLAVFAAVFLSFCFLYAAFAGTGWWLSRSLLPALRIGSVLDASPIRKGQIKKEVLRSLRSMAIFGGYGVLTVEAFRAGWIGVAWDATLPRTLIEIVVLFVWNEVHFFACHRLLHTRWLYRHVHRIHHESIPPTPFSIFSFHWFEAFLLGSVMILAMLLKTFSLWALLSLPVFSALFNTIGHWNYNLFAGTNRRSASAEHSRHHQRVTGNYGFYLPYLDRMFQTTFRISSTK
jgi:lathosterol oxidase